MTTSASDSPLAPLSSPFPADSIHVAARLAEGEVTPRHSPFVGFAIAGLVIFAVGGAGFILKFANVPRDVIEILGVSAGLIALGTIIWTVVQGVRRARRRKNPALDVSDPSVRLRLVGAPKSTAPIMAGVEDAAFEPVILRSIFPLSFATEQSPGVPDTRKRRRKNHYKTRSAGPASARAIQTTCAILGAAAALALHFLALRGVMEGMAHFEVMAGAAVGMGVGAFLSPAYLRVAPGVLDVFHFGFLGHGTPDVQRFDLRAASVLADQDFGYVTINDPTRPKDRILIIHSRFLLGAGESASRAILMGAISRHPTPPMPIDDLSE